MNSATAIPTPAQGFAPMAKLCAGAALAAYADAATIIGRDTNTQILILSGAERTIIAFRGTKEIQDWITDARFLRTSFFFGEVHAGFKDGLYDVIKNIRAVLDDSNPVLPLYITGHSLGGAEAVLCAATLQYFGYSIAGVFTFGQPRVGNKEFAAHYDASPLGPRTYRFINEDDIVPRLPGALLGYRHCGQSFFFSNLGGLEANPKLWMMALSDAFGIWEDWRIRHELSCLEDHQMTRYLGKVNAL